ncbi:MAG: transposase [Opitutus sp.]|nr:transposase [Opitutus sp.]
MARKPRIEFAGAHYHVLNRGNYRGDLFETAGAAQAFVICLGEACERMGWRVHAYCLMRNHYHLAIETPRGNLVSGVHWLQSTFGNRFNRYRGERGRAFQGRYQAILVEPGVHLTRLVDYIHLNPVRARIVSLQQLAQFRWSSYRWFARGSQERPVFLSSADWLHVHGELADSPEGWRIYHAHLEWLMADDGRQKAAAFERMSQGWMHGGEAYQRELLKSFRKIERARDWGGTEVAEINRLHWRDMLERGSRALGESLARAPDSAKSAPWKIALAAWIKRSSSVSNRWLSEQLAMGAPDGVSRYVGELKRGGRPEATRLIERLTTKIRG